VTPTPARPAGPDKAVLRRAVLSRRAALPPDERDRAEQEAVAVLGGHDARRVALYAAVGTEPGTQALLEAFADREVLLPVLLADGDLDWARADGGPLVQTGTGLLEPQGERLGRDAIAGCDLVVVPALSVDSAGNRLGRGGGSYDRALTRTQACTVALLHAGEVVGSLPVQPHDRPVHAVVVPGHGLVRFAEHPGERER
jgi:5-formyltetrahydrofolate cyclo-ligase